MHKNKKQRTRKRFSGLLFRSTLFTVCGTLAFFVGLQSANESNPVISVTEAQVTTTNLNVILQYQPIDGSSPRPIEVTPFMNGTQTALFLLQEVHSGVVYPLDATQRCRMTNTLGRCTVRGLPVGPNPQAGIDVDRQYDIIVDATFIEFLTGIAIQEQLVHIRFDHSSCSGEQNFAVHAGGSWCLGPTGGPFAQEYYVTITLNERDDCSTVQPPSPMCGDSRSLTTFTCKPSTSSSTRPWEPITQLCEPVRCSNGKTVIGACEEIVSGLASCSSSAACVNEQRCQISGFNGSGPFEAGTDSITIQGQRFGNQGGTVFFQVEGGVEQGVQVGAGARWQDTQITVAVPRAAVSGIIRVHPNTHGSMTDSGGTSTPVRCQSPSANIRSFSDQFSIVSVTPQVPAGTALVSPGFETTFHVRARHNSSIAALEMIDVELLDGAFVSTKVLPPDPLVIARTSCNTRDSLITGSSTAATFECTVNIPSAVSAYDGPFTFLFTLKDSESIGDEFVLVDAGASVLTGDFNLDGQLTILDAIFARRIVSGTQSADANQLLRDTNGDNQITQSDVVFVLHSLTQP